MILYRTKAFFKDEVYSWLELKYYNITKCIFDFNAYEYEVNGKLFSEDSNDFREALTEIQMWDNLQKNHRSHLEILKDFHKVAVEIENAKNAGTK